MFFQPASDGWNVEETHSNESRRLHEEDKEFGFSQPLALKNKHFTFYLPLDFKMFRTQ